MEKMNKKKFRNAVVSLDRRISCSDGFFYEPPINHVLSGFFCDQTRTGITISIYAFPLFEKRDAIHLHFSKYLELEDSSLPSDSLPEEISAQIFLDRIEKYRKKANDLKDLNLFSRFLNEFWNEDIQVRKTKIFTNILLGKNENCIEEMEQLLSENNNRPEFTGDILTLKNDLLRSPTAALQTMQIWEHEMKAKFNIPN